jgi:glucose-1-phosphatase
MSPIRATSPGCRTQAWSARTRRSAVKSGSIKGAKGRGPCYRSAMLSPAPADIRLVCFDLGGVVVRTCASSQEACARAGVRYRPEVGNPEVRSRLTEAEAVYQVGRCSTAEYFLRAEAALGGRQTAAEIALVHDAWILGEYEGMDRLVGSIHSLGLTATCLSNTNERHWELMIAQPQIYRAFAALTHRHASHLLGLAKPDPEIYRMFEQRCGIPATGIIFFDDREENIVAARSAGWRAVTIDPSGDTKTQAVAALRRLGLGV